MMGDDGPERFGAQMKRRNGSLAPGRAASISPERKLTLKVANAPVDLADDEPLLEIPPMIALRHYDDWPSETITAMEIFEDKHRRLARATETLTVSLGGPQLTSASYASAVVLGLEEVRRNRFFVDEVSTCYAVDLGAHRSPAPWLSGSNLARAGAKRAIPFPAGVQPIRPSD